MLRVLALSRVCSSRAMASSKRFIGGDEPTPIAYTRAVRAVDLHVHLPLPEWVEGSLGPYREATERYFRRRVTLSTAEELAGVYEALDCVGVLLAWDAETATGRPPLSNDLVAGIVPGSRAGSSASPRWTRGSPPRWPSCAGPARSWACTASSSTPRCRPSGPTTPASPSCSSRPPPTGRRACSTPAPAASGPAPRGGQGVELGYARPIHLDAVAARHPELPVVMAHFGWPWHTEAVAIALHKANVHPVRLGAPVRPRRGGPRGRGPPRRPGAVRLRRPVLRRRQGAGRMGGALSAAAFARVARDNAARLGLEAGPP